MKRFKNILVATDTRLDSHPILDEAVEIAQHNDATLKIVDVVPEFPWTVRLTLHDHEHMLEMIAEETRQRLDKLAAPLREMGIAVTTRVFRGKTSIEIIREVLRSNHDLVLRVAKGKDSRRHGFFGNTGIKLLRKCPCAVWLVAPGTTPKFKHVLGCVDTSSGEQLDAELNDKVYELTSSISQYHGGRFSIIHAWSIWNEQMLKSRMSSDEFLDVENKNRAEIQKLLDQFLGKHPSHVRADNICLVKGEAPVAIPEFAAQNGVDLVVMGTVARSGLTGVIMGNTAEQILNGIKCSVLALKPDSFVCPVQLDK